uniref:RIC3 domain-containing protein n=1 Tax=Steinernema glaseri TaxID=37863 RepID=A0A1I7XXP0_9BILA
MSLSEYLSTLLVNPETRLRKRQNLFRMKEKLVVVASFCFIGFLLIFMLLSSKPEIPMAQSLRADRLVLDQMRQNLEDSQDSTDSGSTSSLADKSGSEVLDDKERTSSENLQRVGFTDEAAKTTDVVLDQMRQNLEDSQDRTDSASTSNMADRSGSEVLDDNERTSSENLQRVGFTDEPAKTTDGDGPLISTTEDATSNSTESITWSSTGASLPDTSSSSTEPAGDDVSVTASTLETSLEMDDSTKGNGTDALVVTTNLPLNKTEIVEDSTSTGQEEDVLSTTVIGSSDEILENVTLSSVPSTGSTPTTNPESSSLKPLEEGNETTGEGNVPESSKEGLHGEVTEAEEELSTVASSSTATTLSTDSNSNIPEAEEE